MPPPISKEPFTPEWKKPVAAAGSFSYPLKAGVLRRFKTQRLPINVTDLIGCIKRYISIDGEVLTNGMREFVNITRREEELFTHVVTQDTITAQLSPAEVAKRAQMRLLEVDYLDPRELREALLQRIEEELNSRGIPNDREYRINLFNLITLQNPGLIRSAAKRCSAAHCEVVDAAALPEAIESDEPLPTSRLNIYGVVTPGLNGWETDLVKKLDCDVSGTILWWHRNEPRKPWSIAVTLPGGNNFYPDFVVGVRDRRKEDGILLVETKEAIGREDALEKAVAEHKLYGRAMMLHWEKETGRWMTVRYDEKADKNVMDSVFRIDLMVSF